MTQNNEKQKTCKLSPGWSGYIIFLITVFVGVALDLWSKAAIFQWLSSLPYRTFTIVEGFFYFVMAENPGAAFGIAAGRQYSLIAISAIALVIILGIFFFSRSLSKLMCFSLGLFAAGITGNLYDRIFNGGLVRDFIDVVYWPSKHWPTFNVADSMLCIAVGLVFISGFFTADKSCQKPSQQHKSDT